jgi:hypothetical protein
VTREGEVIHKLFTDRFCGLKGGNPLMPAKKKAKKPAKKKMATKKASKKKH